MIIAATATRRIEKRGVSLRVAERVEVDAEERHGPDFRAEHAARACRVGEDLALEQQGQTECRHREVHAARAQGGKSDEDPDRHGAGDAGEHRQLERHVEAGYEAGRDPRADPGEPELGERELARVAGDDDHRQRHEPDGGRQPDRLCPGR